MNRTELETAHRAMAMSREIERFCLSKSPHWYAGVGQEVVGTFLGTRREDFAAPHSAARAARTSPRRTTAARS